MEVLSIEIGLRIAEAEKISDVGGSVMVENRYFDCWLLAVEETLADQGLIAGEEISQKIEDIRISVAGIRDAQKGRASREGI